MNDRELARSLGWFSIGLGLAELFAARTLSRSLGLDNGVGGAGLVRAFGAREVANGVAILSNPVEPMWLWGHMLDLVVLGAAALAPDNPKRASAALEVTVLDVACAKALADDKARALRTAQRTRVWDRGVPACLGRRRPPRCGPTWRRSRPAPRSASGSTVINQAPAETAWRRPV
jgi:hypothetical protein